MVENKTKIDENSTSVYNLYNDSGESFEALLAQGIRLINLHNLQKHIVINTKEKAEKEGF